MATCAFSTLYCNCFVPYFIVKILQGLIHCAPLANLLRSIPLSLLESLERAPFLLAFHKLFSQFYETIAGRHLNEEPVIPEELVDAIRHGSGTDAFQGEQEDAQEFLTFILDHLHQEFALNKELLHWQFSETTEALFRSESLQEEGGWMEVGPKQRVSETRTMAQTETPISFLFAGQFRSTVRRPRIKDSITFEPFNCLPLEVHHRHISSIEEALQSLSRPERIEESGITKYVTLSRLPMILIIQLKRFVFNQEHGRIEKVNKHIAYPEKLVLPRSCYTMTSQHAGSNPTYRLTAVVYHHGRTAEGGHYTADVRKSFKMDEHWQRINDASIQAVSLEAVLGERRHSDSSAYLLIYQRYKDMKHQL